MENAVSFRSSSLLPLTPSSFPIPSHLPTELRFSRLKRSSSEERRRDKPLRIRKAFGSDENGQFDGFPNMPNKIFMEEVIGAEYGEGFETFRPEGPLKIDVDFLNDRMQEGFLQRIRYAMKPDEAYGLIFSWDNVVADTRGLKLHAWGQLASEEGKEIPGDDNVQRFLLYAGADHVLRKVLLWGKAEDDVDRLKSRLSQLYYENLLKAIVSEEDGMDSIAHRFLSAAVKLDRKPSKCVVFEDDPRGITAAHNCTMMAVALIGAHPAYHLGQADLAVGSFNELSVINLRRLFAHKGSTFMDLQKQVIEKTPRRRKLTTDTIF
ncbi:UNVERIFIED_CONTAM: hypothetical protein Scaly_2474600 [Sesamum calycinum]|uniref:Haloacid dehalogenase-like hydrolase superfamily protein n=1 Tax=Sesamum calycinum TaxID=2727403 RepID=A0AAW2LR46_9LAMI